MDENGEIVGVKTGNAELSASKRHSYTVGAREPGLNTSMRSNSNKRSNSGKNLSR